MLEIAHSQDEEDVKRKKDEWFRHYDSILVVLVVNLTYVGDADARIPGQQAVRFTQYVRGGRGRLSRVAQTREIGAGHHANLTPRQRCLRLRASHLFAAQPPAGYPDIDVDLSAIRRDLSSKGYL